MSRTAINVHCPFSYFIQQEIDIPKAVNAELAIRAAGVKRNFRSNYVVVSIENLREQNEYNYTVRNDFLSKQIQQTFLPENKVEMTNERSEAQWIFSKNRSTKKPCSERREKKPTQKLHAREKV